MFFILKAMTCTYGFQNQRENKLKNSTAQINENLSYN